MLHFVTSSVALMSSTIMTQLQQQHLVWRSWVAHVDYFLRLLDTEFTEHGLNVLEGQIKHAHRLFLAVPEFQGLWLPKHHFALHFPSDIRNYGPPRFYWCMRFESKNQECKRAARTSNFFDVAHTVVDFIVTRSADRLRHGKTSSWSQNGSISTAKSAVKATERLTGGCCHEHTAAYNMLGKPRDVLWVNWLSCVQVNGLQMGRSSWVLFRSGGNNITYLAEVQTVFSITQSPAKVLTQGDAVYFVTTMSCSMEAISLESGQTVGNFLISDTSWKLMSSTRVFACYDVEVSELIHYSAHGMHRFVMCP